MILPITVNIMDTIYADSCDLTYLYALSFKDNNIVCFDLFFRQ